MVVNQEAIITTTLLQVMQHQHGLIQKLEAVARHLLLQALVLRVLALLVRQEVEEINVEIYSR